MRHLSDFRRVDDLNKISSYIRNTADTRGINVFQRTFSPHLVKFGEAYDRARGINSPRAVGVYVHTYTPKGLRKEIRYISTDGRGGSVGRSVGLRQKTRRDGTGEGATAENR